MPESNKLSPQKRQSALLEIAADLRLLGGILDKKGIKKETKKELEDIRLKTAEEHPGRFEDDEGNRNNAYIQYMRKAFEFPNRLPNSLAELSKEILDLAKENPNQFTQPHLQKILAAGTFASIFFNHMEDKNEVLAPMKKCTQSICRNVESLSKGASISERTKGTTWFNRKGGKAVNVNQTLKAASQTLKKLSPESAKQFEEARELMHEAFETILEESGQKVEPESPPETELKTAGSRKRKQTEMELTGSASATDRGQDPF